METPASEDQPAVSVETAERVSRRPNYFATRPMNDKRNTNPETGTAIRRKATRARGRCLVHQVPAARKASWARACKKTNPLLRSDCCWPALGLERDSSTDTGRSAQSITVINPMASTRGAISAVSTANQVGGRGDGSGIATIIATFTFGIRASGYRIGLALAPGKRAYRTYFILGVVVFLIVP
jgi:hypothetical protein